MTKILLKNKFSEFLKVEFRYLLKNPATWLYFVFGIFSLLLIIWAVSYYSTIRRPVSPLIDAVPPTPALMLNFKNTPGFLNKLSYESMICKELYCAREVHELYNNIQRIDSLALTDSHIYELYCKRPVTVAFYMSGDTRTDLIFFVSLPDSRQKEKIEEFMSGIYKNEGGVNAYSYANAEIYSSPHVRGKKTLFWTVYKGIFACSFSEKLISETINQLDKPSLSLKNDRLFGKVFLSTGKKVDANVFVNYTSLAKLAGQFISDSRKYLLSALSNFAGWSGLDITVKRESILLSGYTSAVNDKHFLGLFDRQTAPEMSLTSFVPYNTSFLIYYGFDDFSSFYPGLKAFNINNNLHNSNYNKVISECNSAGIDLENVFVNIVGNEYALVSTATDNESSGENVFAVFNVKDSADALHELDKLSEAFPLDNDCQSKDAETFMKYHCGGFNLPAVVPAFTGNIFAAVNSNYYILYKDFLIFGNSINSLKKFIAYIEAGKTLSSNVNFTNFSTNINGEANLLIYGNIRKSLKLFSSLFNGDIQNIAVKHYNSFRNFEAFALEFSAKDNMYYTGACLKYNLSYIDENPSIWEVSLDTTVNSKPLIINDFTDNTKKIVVFDILNNMYLVDNKGSIVWKKSIPEKIISNVYQADLLKNGKLQFVFNSVSKIYAVDIKGAMVNGFPVKIPGVASAGMAVFDYDNKKDYRFVIPLKDKRIINITSKGEMVRGWSIPALGSPSKISVVHYKMGSNDALVTASEKGIVYIINRKGAVVYTSKGKFKHSPNSGFYSDGKAVLTAGTDGLIHCIYSKTKTEVIKIGRLSESSSFIYYDINNDNKPEFILCDKELLALYSASGTLLFDYKSKPFLTKNLFVAKAGGKSVIVCLSEEGTLELFNSGGRIKSETPVKGSKYTCAGAFMSDDALNVITSVDNKLYNYLIDF